MKIAVVGSGIGGVSAAYYLNKFGHEVSLFESGSYFGGHTHTHKIELDGQSFPVDTGFLVHNDRTYPLFIEFLKELNLKSFNSDMSFSVKIPGVGFEWGGENLGTVFAQKKNLFNPSMWRMILGILRFNKNSARYLELSRRNPKLTLGQLLKQFNYSREFKDWYLLPMGGCIWSTPTHKMLDFPAHTFLNFCINHGLLQIFNRPQWKSLKGGCNTYTIMALSQIENKFTSEPVINIKKVENKKVRLTTSKREETYDAVVLAAHPPQILNILKIPEHPANDLLKHFSYQKNIAVLHTDSNVLPVNKQVWSSWNYSSSTDNAGVDRVSVSYLINKLQPVPISTPIIVTLNPEQNIDPKLVIKTINYEHPLFDENAINSQPEIQKIQGVDNIYFSGAWLRYGFHEDGIWATHQFIKEFSNENS